MTANTFKENENVCLASGINEHSKAYQNFRLFSMLENYLD